MSKWDEEQKLQGARNKAEQDRRFRQEAEAQHAKRIEERTDRWLESLNNSQAPPEPIPVDPEGCRNTLLGLALLIAILCIWGYIQKPTETPSDLEVHAPKPIAPHSEQEESRVEAEPPLLPKPTSIPPASLPHIRVLNRVMPVYPEEAEEGTVTLIVMVAPDGSVLSVENEQGDLVLFRAAAEAVRQWQYEPLDPAQGTFPRKTRAILTLRRK